MFFNRISFILICSFFFIQKGFSQGINTEFGKNRVQYHDDFLNWDSYETANFIVYWYGKARYIAQFTIQMAEYDFKEIQSVLEHRINDKIEILVYLDLTDQKQSNLGSEESFVSETGQTKIIGNKIFVYFDGNHQNLRKQIREGISKVYLNSMFFGNAFQELVQNAALITIPEWYKQGIVAYIGSNWNLEIEDEYRELRGRYDEDYTNFDDLSKDHPRVAGHIFWHYIEQQYGVAALANCLYLTRINRNIETAFLYAFGTSFNNILYDLELYYDAYYDYEIESFQGDSTDTFLKLGNKKYDPYSHLSLSPNADRLLYVVNNIGKAEVRLYDFNSDSDKRIFKTGHKNKLQETDYNYPLIAWHPNGEEISIMYEFRDVIKLRKIRVETGEHIEQTLPEIFHRVYSMSYINDEDYIFAASTDGFSDLYKYESAKRVPRRLTEDYHDDLDAIYTDVNGIKGILFSSNRTSTILERKRLDTILPIGNFDVFFYPFETLEGELIRLTNTSEENERMPQICNENHLTLISDKSGLRNRKLIDLKTDRTYLNSNKKHNIILHNGAKNSDKYLYTYYHDGQYKLFLETPDWEKEITPFKTKLAKAIESRIAQESTVGVINIKEEPEKEEDNIKEEYLFQTEYPDPKNVERLTSSSDNESNEIDLFSPIEEIDQNRSVHKFQSQRIVASRLSFKLDYFTTKLDNEQLFEGLESFSGINNEFENPPVGILLKGNTKDLFEDYVIEAGLRIPMTFNGTEYFVVFDNKKKHIDQRFAFYRKAENNTVDPFVFPTNKTRRITNLGLYRLSYPFDVYRSVRATTSLRLDRFFFKSSDNPSYEAPEFNEQRIGLKLEYVFDNTIDIDLNIMHGTRYKFYVETFNRFDLSFQNGFSLDPSLGFTTLFGVDARHYVPIGRHGVWATRFSAAGSVGSERMLYYLGGTDNWIGQSFNNSIPLSQSTAFAYKSLVPNLRGFDYNIRNGTSYALVNSEVRLPIFKMISKKRIKNAMLRNFQVVGFLDAGTAWYGLTPFSDANPLNTLVLENPPTVVVEIEYFRDPLVVGYGFGFRTTLLGYFIRLDIARGIETRVVQDQKIYFSIGTDF